MHSPASSMISPPAGPMTGLGDPQSVRRGLLASGRDADIFEAGTGLVLRRSREGRSLEREAEVMEYVRRAGFPAPAVHEIGARGTELFMERLVGPSMMDVILCSPLRLPALAKTLARLHRQLGAITAPAAMPQLPDGGSSVVHFDLHPMNVLMTAKGPFVIDWATAARGQSASDVASTWVIVQSSQIPGSTFERALANLGRRAFLSAFLHASGQRDAARHALPVVITARLADPHLAEPEIAFLHRWQQGLAITSDRR